MIAGRTSSNDLVRFNARCRAVALLWLVVVVSARESIWPADHDFGQFYMGGLIARLGEWAALYPQPIPGSPLNAGWTDGSVPKPRFAQLAKQRGANTGNRYIQSPATALLLIPLAWLPYTTAHWAWLLLLCVAGWRVAVQAGLTLEAITSRPVRASGMITLMIACSPLMHRAVRVGNVSPLVAWCIGAAVLDLLRGRAARGAGAIVAGSLLKYAPAVLLLVAAGRRNWRFFGGALAGLALAAMVSWAIAGGAPMSEFVRSIAPTLGRSAFWRGNQTLQGVILRWSGASVLTRLQGLIVMMACWITLAPIVLLTLRRVRPAGDPAFTLASSAALVAWLLIFAPIAWEHYYVYFCPLWGWLAWETTQGLLRRGAAWVVWITHCFPWPLLQGRFQLPEPFTSVMLLGAIVILALAISRLATAQPKYGAAASAG